MCRYYCLPHGRTVSMALSGSHHPTTPSSSHGPWECLSGNMPFCYFLLDIPIDSIFIICLFCLLFLASCSGLRIPHPLPPGLDTRPSGSPQAIANSTTQGQPIFFHISVPLVRSSASTLPTHQRQAGVPMPGEKSHLFIVILLVGDQRFFSYHLRYLAS